MSKLTPYDIEFEDFCREEQVSNHNSFRDSYKLWLGGEQPTEENLIGFTDKFKKGLTPSWDFGIKEVNENSGKRQQVSNSNIRQ